MRRPQTGPLLPRAFGALHGVLARWRGDVSRPRVAVAAGRDDTRAALPPLPPAVARELELALREALEREAFTLAYQPVVPPGGADAAPLGVEVLARWTHPTLGALPPALFLPVADATGLAVTLDRFVMERACAALAAAGDGGGAAPLHLNLAASQLERCDLPAFVRQLLVHHRLPAGALALELPAAGLGTEPERFAPLLTELRDLGVALWIDDAGSDAVSALRWADLGAVGMKLAPRFAQQLAADPHPEGRPRRALAARVVEAHAHGLALVVKGVEERRVLALLGALGVDGIQGYAVAPPYRDPGIGGGAA